MQYSLPRLTRAWTHLSRQSGGGGTGARGEGETQLETDRRIVRRRIDRVKQDLKIVRKQRATQRKNRLRIPLPHAAIVGYTNAGKSSLLTRLTGAQVLIEDKLFATLDTTTRKIQLPNGQRLLLTDTVGFVRRLPHDLIEAFKATLEEAVLADFRIHVLDAGHPKVLDFHRTTLEVLDELGADKERMLTVFNKIDTVADRTLLLHLRNRFPGAVFMSVKTGEGEDELVHRLANMISELAAAVTYRFPLHRSDLVSALHENGKVISATYEEDAVMVQAILPRRLLGRFREFETGEVLAS
jgi:GTP-binding protein HflX